MSSIAEELGTDPATSRGMAGRGAGAGRAILIMAVAGIAVRLVLAPLTSYPNDDLPWYWMAVSGMQHLPVYARPGFSYPPVWGWILEFVGMALRAFGATPASLGIHDAALNGANTATGGALATIITSPLLNVCIKAVLTGADLLTAVLLSRATAAITDRPRAPQLAFGLYFLNPLVINECAVRAGIDGLVALTVAATLVAVIRGRAYTAGLALGLGVFVKLTPLLLAPLVIAALWSAACRRDPGVRALRQPAAFAAGAVSVGAAVLLALTGTGQWAGFLENTFSRAQTGLLIGGPGLGGLRHFAVFSGLAGDASAHSSTTLDVSLVIEVLAVAGMTVWTWVAARRSPTRALVVSSTVVMAVVVLTTPTSQPGYVLWFLGPLTMLAAVSPRGYGPFVVSLSLAALVFSLTYYSPAQVLFPLAEYTGWIRPHDLAAGVQHWFLRPTALWGASYKEDYASACAAVSIVSYAFLVARCLDDRGIVRAGPAGSERPDAPMGRRSDRATAILVSVSAVTMVAATVVPAPPSGSAGARLVRSDLSAGHLKLTFTTRPLADQRQTRLVYFPLAEAVQIRHVYVVVDPTAPIASTTREDVRGVFDRLRAELKLRGYGGSVSTITASGLARLMSGDAPPSKSAVVDTMGVLPQSVFSPSSDMLLRWLRQGGVMYWGGYTAGLLYAGPGQSVPEGWQNGPRELMGAAGDMAPHPLAQASKATSAARTLGLQYQGTSYSPSASEARSEGAQLLGYVSSDRSSITSFPEGSGRLVVFGGLMYDNYEVASDIALLQMSGTPFASGMVSESTRPATSGNWPVSVTPEGGVERVVVLDPSRSGISFQGATFDLSRCRPGCPAPAA